MNKTVFRFVSLLLAAALCLAASICPAQQSASRPAEPVLLVLKDGSRVQGVPQKADANEIVLLVGKTPRTLPNDQVTPVSVYMARRALADLTKADTHVELGNFLLRAGQNALAKREFEQAVKIDPALAATVKPALDALGDASAGTLATPVAAVTTAPAGGSASQPAPKFRPATTQQAAAVLQKAQDWAAEANKFVPTLRRVESPHFLIFSGRESSSDKPVSDLCERMYTSLCKQFDIPPADNLYAGKCVLFLFQDKDHYKKFASDVVKGEARLGEAAGFCHSNGIEVFIILGPAKNSYWFNELMVHESTHGFLARYQSTRHIPSWLNEGLADYIAATLVPTAHAAEDYVQAQRKAVREKTDVTSIFTTVGLNEFDYGIAQSFVRYLIARDRLGFVKLITLLKEGKTEADALKESYGLTRDDFLRDWRKAIAQ